MKLKNANIKFRVIYDSNNGGVFTVHNPRKKDMNFNMHKDRLYNHNTNNNYVTLVQTLSGNESGYFER